jgi:hypothetical protein
MQRANVNPMVQSMSMTDEKAMSSMSILEDRVARPIGTNKITKSKVVYQTSNKEFMIENLMKLDNY